jgi:imidazolonepropionase-like amidohydrolase
MVRNAGLKAAVLLLTIIGISGGSISLSSQGGGGGGQGGGRGGQPVVGGAVFAPDVFTQLPGVFTGMPMSIYEGLTRWQSQTPPKEGVAIRAGRLFDAKAGVLLVNQVIVLRGDVITDIGPAASVQIPAGAQVIDLSKETVMPGMIDLHVHLWDAIAQRVPNEATIVLRGLALGMQHLRGGFTTLVDMGSGDSWAGIDTRNAINRGWVPGPRVQVAGPALNPRANGNYPTPSTMVPSFGEGPYAPGGRPHMQNSSNFYSAADGIRLIREHSWYGADWIKIYLTEDIEGGGEGGAFFPDGRMINVPSLTLEETKAAVDEAHRRGLKVATHVYGGEGLRIALQTGIDVPMHVIVGINGASGLDDETVRLFKQPLPNGKMRPVEHTLWDLEDENPKTSYSGIGQGGGGMHSGDLRKTGGETSRMKLSEASFRRLQAAGIKEVFGSGDYGWLGNVPGLQAMQFPIYVKWGVTPAQALQTATINAAEQLNYDLGKKVGTLEKGKYADIIAVSGDPLQDVSEMLKVKFVMKGGIVYRNDLVAPAPAK